MPLTLFSISLPTRAFHLMPTRADVCLVSAVLVLNVFSYLDLFAPFPSSVVQWITISLFFSPSLPPSHSLLGSLSLSRSLHMFHFICFVQHKIQSLLWHCTSRSFSMMSVFGSDENGLEPFSFRHRISFCRIGQNTPKEVSNGKKNAFNLREHTTTKCEMLKQPQQTNVQKKKN